MPNVNSSEMNYGNYSLKKYYFRIRRCILTKLFHLICSTMLCCCCSAFFPVVRTETLPSYYKKKNSFPEYKLVLLLRHAEVFLLSDGNQICGKYHVQTAALSDTFTGTGCVNETMREIH